MAPSAPAVRVLRLEPLSQPPGVLDLNGIDLVLVTGARGPRARPLHPSWVRSVREQCVAAGVAFCFQGWGEWVPASQITPGLIPPASVPSTRCRWLQPDGRSFSLGWGHWSEPHDVIVYRVGPAQSGRLLDGRVWQQWPAPVESTTAEDDGYPD